MFSAVLKVDDEELSPFRGAQTFNSHLGRDLENLLWRWLNDLQVPPGEYENMVELSLM